jgi:hypothetical protein
LVPQQLLAKVNEEKGTKASGDGKANLRQLRRQKTINCCCCWLGYKWAFPLRTFHLFCCSFDTREFQLKQLTSLIQSKAANSAQQQQQQQQSNVVPTNSSVEQGSASEQQQLNQKKAKKGASIASLSAEQQQPSTSTSSSGSAEQTQQKQPKRRRKPAADKMVVSTSRQPTELK